jgi:hypothetical protein
LRDEFEIREASEKDFPQIVEFLKAARFGPAKLEWLQWKYLENPPGRARVFLMTGSGNAIKGLIAYLPHDFANGSLKQRTVMQAVDGVLAPEVRGKGLYPRLLQYSMSKFNHPLLGFPNKRAEGLHLRCNWRALKEEERWEFPCAIGKLFTSNPAKSLAPLADSFSQIYARFWLGPQPNGIEMKVVKKFQKNFFLDSDGMVGVRSAEFLNWRFIDNPMRAYFCHEYYDGGDCIGYSAYGLDGLSAELFDFVVVRKRRQCLRLFVEHCRSAGITHILFRGIGLKLRRYGFLKRRGSGNYIAFGLPKGHYTITLADSDW